MSIHDWAEIAGSVLFAGFGIFTACLGFLILTLAIHLLIDAWSYLTRSRP
jgi:hypothetical protein